MAEKQKTIKKPVSVKGKGLHTGIEVTLTFKPAKENFGYRFQRIDLEGKPIIHAIVDNVVSTARSTVIGDGDKARIGTVEHVLSALYGLGIDNALIEIDGPETPIMDGSARYFAEALEKAGIEEQAADKKFFVVKSNIGYCDEENGIEIMTFPDEDLSINVMINYHTEVLGNQYAILNSLSEYRSQIAECRTYVLFNELEILYKNNLIKGGDLENAIVIVDKDVPQKELDRIADLFNQPHVQVQSQGVLNNIELKFNNEPARHKLLDLLGDIALIGMPIKGKILATRPGHASNVEFAKKIRQTIKRGRSKNAPPVYDPNKPPLFDINHIKNLLPHRPPFLLIDKILDMTDTEIVGLKNVTLNENFFTGHFPDEPIMPGVLIIEAMAQVGGILALSTVPDPENYLTYFMKIDKVKFRRQVVPGDTIIFRLELLGPIRRGIVNMRGYAFVGDGIATEGELMAQITKAK